MVDEERSVLDAYRTGLCENGCPIDSKTIGKAYAARSGIGILRRAALLGRAFDPHRRWECDHTVLLALLEHQARLEARYTMK
jgi:hypothetical protein